MAKLNIVVHDEWVQLSQGLGHTMRLPHAYVIDLIEALRYGTREKLNDGSSRYFYTVNGVAFGPRSCKLILFNNGLEPHTVASLKPSTVDKLIEGLLPLVDNCYLSRDERDDL